MAKCCGSAGAFCVRARQGSATSGKANVYAGQPRAHGSQHKPGTPTTIAFLCSAEQLRESGTWQSLLGQRCTAMVLCGVSPTRVLSVNVTVGERLPWLQDLRCLVLCPDGRKTFPVDFSHIILAKRAA